MRNKVIIVFSLLFVMFLIMFFVDRRIDSRDKNFEQFSNMVQTQEEE